MVIAGLFACRSPAPPLAVAEGVDLERYLGRWYEIASFPQRFQEGCVATTATYSHREDGRIRVFNECRDETFDGELREIEGVAWLADSGDPARLKVRFFWPFWGSYWILEVDPEYRHAVVGHPSRDYLWILARTPELPPDVYAGILERVAAQGYDLERLVVTPQP
jgi:apolipoprotein D and lipocalin family protein